MLTTEYEFELPRGYTDKNGGVHSKGVMRLATAADEIMPMRDPRVKENPQYLSVIILSRVITSLGTLERVDNRVVENLFTADLAFLQDMYQRINDVEPPVMTVKCPQCGEVIQMPVNFTAGE